MRDNNKEWINKYVCREKEREFLYSLFVKCCDKCEKIYLMAENDKFVIFVRIKYSEGLNSNLQEP